MLSKLFGSHKREIIDLKHQIWVRWFSAEPPKQSHIQQLPPEVLEIYSQINELYVTKQQINQDLEADSEEFFIKIFNLEEPLNEKTKDLISLLSSSDAHAFINEKVLSVVMVPIMQYIIKWIHQFFKQIDDIVAQKEEALNFAFEGKAILLFVFSLSKEKNDDALYLFSYFYNKLIELMQEGVYIDKFCNEIFKTTKVYLTVIGAPHECDIPFYKYIVNHYTYWISHFHQENFTSDRLNECISVCNMMTNFDPDFVTTYQEVLIDPLLNSGFNMLSFLYIKSKSLVTTQEIASLANSFLKFIVFYISLGPKFAANIWSHQFLHFVPGFAMWALDKFPIIEFPDEREEFCESDLKFFKHNQMEAPVMEFIDNKLQLNLARDARIQNIADSDQILQYSVIEEMDVRISSIPELKECFASLSMMFSCPTSKFFISTFSDLFLSYAERLIDSTKKKLFSFDHSSELLSASFIFFFAQLLLTAPTNIVVEVLKERDDFIHLTNTFIFSQKYNTWSTNMERTDNQFFYETRFKIYTLFANCYQNEPSSHKLIISALSNVFNSSPLIIDELNKFIIVLFRTNPEMFAKAIIETRIIENASQYMIDLQYSNIAMIDDDYDFGKIQLLRQSRIHIFHFFDLLACIDLLRSQLFSTSLFAKAIFHFFFEDATQEYAFDMWKNGLLVDNSFFINNDISPITNTFPLQEKLFHESLNHVDEPKWVSLITKYLKLLTEVLPFNRKTLVDWFDKYHAYDDLVLLPDITTDHDTVISIINTVLHIFFILAQNSPYVRKIIARNPMKTISEKLSTLDFGEETVNRLINLIFERELNMKNLPKNIDIHDSKIIPYVHNATEHLKWHEDIFSYLNAVCSPSVTNKLKIFQSKTPLMIIHYIQSFQSFPAPSKDKYSPSVNSLLILFSTVSSAVFKWKTFYEAIKSMKPIGHHRNWWTVQLISTFSTILSEISYKPPSSFFHFDGRHTGIDLPVIPAGCIQNGMTFMIRLELGANWALDGHKAALLSIVDKYGVSMELFFEGKKLVCKFVNSKDKNFKAYITKPTADGGSIPVEFIPNVWTRIIFTIDEKNMATCYVNKICLCQFQLKGWCRLEGEIQYGKIACSSPRSNSVSENPLIANVSSIYMFDHCLDNDTIMRLASLSNDFCFGFSPIQASSFPEVPKELFTDDINNSLLLCYNPRMTSGNICANFAQRGIGNAKVRGQIIPFSTSFIDVAASMGGLRLFLPILQYVDYPILNEKTDDSVSFLQAMLGLFNQFFQNSDEIIRDFIQTGSTKALAYLLSTISSDSIGPRTIVLLCDILNSLKKDEYKLQMIKDVFLNFSLWHKYSPEIQIMMYETSWRNIYSRNPQLLMKATSIKTFIFLVVKEDNRNLRAAIWRFIRYFSVHQFTLEDQQTLYESAFVDVDNCKLIEILENIHYMLKEKRHNFHKIVETHDYYTPFVHITCCDDEQVRIEAIKILCTIFDLQMENEINTGTLSANVMFKNAILLVLSMFNSNDLTKRTWSFVTNLFYDNTSYQGALLPLISYISLYYEPQLVNKFVKTVNDEFITTEGASNDQIASSPGWMIWIFNIMQQLKDGEAVVGDNQIINEIFAKILISILLHGKNSLNDFIGFTHQIIVKEKLDLTLMIRDVFIFVLDMFPIERLTLENIQMIFTPIFRFIYFPTKREIYARNIQLYEENEIKDELVKIVKRPKSYFHLTDAFQCEANANENTVFSMRITKGGEWLDKDLAKKLVDWIMNIPVSVKEIYDMKLKVSDLIAFIFSCVIQTGEGFVTTYFNMIYPIISSEHSSLSIFSQGVYRLFVINKENGESIFTEFLQTFSAQLVKILKKIAPSEAIKDESFIVEFNENFREPVSSFLFNLSEKENSNAKKAIIASMNATVSRIGNEIEAINPKQFKVHSKFHQKFSSFNHEFQIQKITSEKAWRRLWRELSTNGSPWSTVENAQHWKSSQRLDSHYRRIFFKPNLEFDNHKIASFNRDAATTKLAQEYYQDWLKTHPEGKISHETNKDEDLDDVEEDQTAQKDYSITCSAKLVTIAKNFEGTFYMNEREIAFDGAESQGMNMEPQTNANSSTKNIQFYLNDVDMVLRRAFLHINTGLEFFLKSKRSFFIMFNKKSDRDKIIRALKPRQNQIAIQMTDNVSSMSAFQEATNQWKQGTLSNFDYLMKINLFAGRSLNDLSQYPVFPWIIKDYESETLDIDDPNIYRDLSKPIGTMNEKRLNSCIANYEECPESPERCLYRMHYSNAFYVLNYLVRVEPFTTLHIEVNDKKFDKANRMFTGIGRAWKAVTSIIPDYRELIPEFYSTPEFLINANNFDLGTNDDGTKNSDVTLPNWAKSPEDFIVKHRRAFESQYVSQHLNEWIDLIFGFKQQGPAAVAAKNTFHKYCYRSTVTKEVLDDPDELQTIQFTAGNVGIIPCQVFNSAHPKRDLQTIPSVTLSVGKKMPIFIPLFEVTFFVPTSKYSFLALSGSSAAYTADFDSNIAALTTNSVTEPVLTRIGSISEFTFLSGSSEKSFAYFSDISRLVVSSPWDSCFHVFRYEGNQLAYVFTERQKCALIYSIYNIGRNFLLTTWRDSSISLYNIEKHEQIYRITPHHASVVDADGMQSLDLLASVDKDGNVVLSRLSSGSFIRSFQAKGHVQKILLIELGFIVIASSEIEGKTNLTVYSINTREVASADLAGSVLSWTRIGTDFNQMIVISLDNNRICSLSIPDLKIIGEENVETNIKALNYEPSVKGIIGRDVQSRIFYFQIC